MPKRQSKMRMPLTKISRLKFGTKRGEACAQSVATLSPSLIPSALTWTRKLIIRKRVLRKLSLSLSLLTLLSLLPILCVNTSQAAVSNLPQGGYSYSQLEGFWTGAGGSAITAPIAAAIAMAESGGSNVIQQGQPYSTTGWGLWQI